MSDSFQAYMVDALATQVDIAGKAVLEIGADPYFGSARAFKAKGASTIISSDLNDVWFGRTEPGITTAIIDARYVDRVIPKRSIDIVYGINLLEHLPDIPVIMEALAQVVRPGGVVFLHGHPLWTSARGHHALLGDPSGWTLNFETSNPIPLWGHLTLDEEQLLELLQDRDDAVQSAAVDWCFRSDLITRTPRLQIIKDVTGGPFKTRHVWEDSQEAPDQDTLDLIRRSKWWNPEEDYSVRSSAFVLEAA